MSELVHVCGAAKFACSMALTRKEFLDVASVYTKRPLTTESAGPAEIYQTLKILRERGQFPVHAVADRPLFKVNRTASGEIQCGVTALSPSDGELKRFLASIAALMPQAQPATTKIRLPNPEQNDLSVALWVTIGDVQLLLGADVEEHGVAGRGWTAILASATRPDGLASLFKISHHGSVNGHHDGIWSNMLERAPFAVLTPWTLGASYLPQPDDVSRIRNLTPNAYSTSRLTAPGLHGLPQVASRVLREAGITIRQAEPPTGFIRLRRPSAGMGPWDIAASDEAVRLS
jgi:hypothetical protein